MRVVYLEDKRGPDRSFSISVRDMQSTDPNGVE
jgi:hypothetical protein